MIEGNCGSICQIPLISVLPLQGAPLHRINGIDANAIPLSPLQGGPRCKELTELTELILIQFSCFC